MPVRGIGATGGDASLAARADLQAGALAEAIAVACRRLHARGLLAGAEGNVSVRLVDGSVLVTPSGTDKAAMTAEAVLRVRAEGTGRHEVVTGPPDGRAGRDTSGRPSSELEMHLSCYAARPDVTAVVHAHPPAATAFATAGVPLPDDVLPELPVVVGPVALVPYGRPGTAALSDAMRPFLAGHDLFLLANHGVTATGRTLEEAMLRMESAEQAARILLGARLLGGARPLPAGERDALAALRVDSRRGSDA